MRKRVETHRLSHPRKAKHGALDQVAGTRQAQALIVAARADAEVAMEQPLQMPQMDAGLRGDLRQRNRVGHGVAHQRDRALDRRRDLGLDRLLLVGGRLDLLAHALACQAHHHLLGDGGAQQRLDIGEREVRGRAAAAAAEEIVLAPEQLLALGRATGALLRHGGDAAQDRTAAADAAQALDRGRVGAEPGGEAGAIVGRGIGIAEHDHGGERAQLRHVAMGRDRNAGRAGDRAAGDRDDLPAKARRCASSLAEVKTSSRRARSPRAKPFINTRLSAARRSASSAKGEAGARNVSATVGGCHAR